MNVVNRKGEVVEVDYNKIKNRIKKLSVGLDIDYNIIVRNVINGIYDNIKTNELDELTVNISSSMISDNYDYGVLASRIALSNHHKMTSPSFSETMTKLYNNGIINASFYYFVETHQIKLRQTIKYSRDYNFDIFGFKTLMKSYLMKINKVVNGKLEFETVERPQDMFMRVAIQIHMYNENAINKVIETYNLMSNKYFTHASPSLYNSGSLSPQLSSCFLLHVSDSIDSMYEIVAECAKISKYAGGISVNVQDIRSSGSFIKGNNGISNGLVPYMKVLNEVARHVNQAGKRLGSIAVYTEPWCSDIISFLNTKKLQGPEETTCRDLFLGLFINDLFMKRVINNEMWSLMNPQECVCLTDSYGDKFNELYEQYESEGKYTSQIKAIDLWSLIIKTQIESGTPYILYKDACNRLSNQNNLGCIKSSNLCSEIVQYSDDDETAVCNLASIGLPMFVIPIKDQTHEYILESDLPQKTDSDSDDNKSNLESLVESDINSYLKLTNNNNKDKNTKYMFDFDKLQYVVRILVNNMNQVINNNHYVNEKTKKSNFKHRPIAIGVQGLADTFIKLGYNFESFEARLLSKRISEHMYYAALVESNKLAEQYGYYPSYNSSRTKKGKLNYDVWNDHCEFMDYDCSTDTWKFNLTNYTSLYKDNTLSEEQLKLLYENSSDIDWSDLKQKISLHGIYNSLLLAAQPTAGTSQILGFNESFEAFTSNMYTRKTLAGTFIVINKYLVNDLKSLGLWNVKIKNDIINNDGSIQNIHEIPQNIKDLYKTVYEIKQKHVINMSADRTKYICQSQSLNIFLDDSSPNKVSNMLIYGWKAGLKTGLYYLRTKVKSQSTKFTQEPEIQKKSKYKCEDEVCVSCSS